MNEKETMIIIIDLKIAWLMNLTVYVLTL